MEALAADVSCLALPRSPAPDQKQPPSWNPLAYRANRLVAIPDTTSWSKSSFRKLLALTSGPFKRSGAAAATEEATCAFPRSFSSAFWRFWGRGEWFYSGKPFVALLSFCLWTEARWNRWGNRFKCDFQCGLVRRGRPVGGKERKSGGTLAFQGGGESSVNC
jgi:hypothetical protein